jgi:hypothetical protein
MYYLAAINAKNIVIIGLTKDAPTYGGSMISDASTARSIQPRTGLRRWVLQSV